MKKILLIFVFVLFVMCGCTRDNETAEEKLNFEVLKASVVNMTPNEDNFFLIDHYGEKLDISFKIKNGNNYLIHSVEIFDSFLNKNIEIEDDDLLSTHSFFDDDYKVYVTEITVTVQRHDFDNTNVKYNYKLNKVSYWNFDESRNVTEKVKQSNLNVINLGASLTSNIKLGDFYYMIREYSDGSGHVSLMDYDGVVEGSDIILPGSFDLVNYKGETKTYVVTTLGEYGHPLRMNRANSLTIPKSIEKIYCLHYNFDYFDRNYQYINEIHYEGNLVEWGNISIDSDCSIISSNTKLFLEEKEIETLEFNSENIGKINNIMGLSSVKKIVVDSSVDEFKSRIYFRNLESVVIEEGVRVIDPEIIYTDKFKYIILPKYITKVNNIFEAYTEYSNSKVNFKIYSYDSSYAYYKYSSCWSNTYYEEEYDYDNTYYHYIYWNGEWELDQNNEPVPLFDKSVH